MEYYNTISSYSYRPCSILDRRDDESWEYDQLTRSNHFDDGVLTGCYSTSTMERWIHESDRPLFTATRLHNDLDMHQLSFQEHLSVPYQDSIPYPDMLSRRLPSPIASGASSHISSSSSDRQWTPLTSPDPSITTCLPEMAYADRFPCGYGTNRSFDGPERSTGGPCVALHEVQNYADAQPEKIAFDEDQAFYASYAQEGYQPIQSNEVLVTNGVTNGTDSTSSEDRCSESPNLRRRRATITRAITSPHLPSKVSKRTKRSNSSHAKVATSDSNGYDHHSSNRAFPCPFAVYGCTSTFGSKNEWKRHVNTQHMKLDYWRCDQCDQPERKPNDFNRKDLFMQHVRRMHPIDNIKTFKSKSAGPRSAKSDPEEQALAATATRCHRRIRSPPEKSGCVFCDEQFTGPTTWDERLEHIGRHMETSKKDKEEPANPQEWQEDQALQKWLEQEGLIVSKGKRWVLTDARA